MAHNQSHQFIMVLRGNKLFDNIFSVSIEHFKEMCDPNRGKTSKNF